MVKEILDSNQEKNIWNNTWLSHDVSSEIDPVKSIVEQIVDYTDEEKSRIDDLMQYVHWVDEVITSWENFANSLEYGLFVTGYNNLSEREQLHFKEIFRDLRIKYLNQKIYNIESWTKKWAEGALKSYKEELAELLK